MNVRQLREALEEAAGIFAASGAKSQKEKIEAFLEIFHGHDDEEVAEFLAGLRQRLSQPDTPVERPRKQPDELIVERYVQRLRDTGTDKTAFDAVFAELSKDKALGKEEAEAIARQYADSRARLDKKGALKEIKTRFSELAYQAVKMMQVDKASRY
jgi:hypothetical protein